MNMHQQKIVSWPFGSFWLSHRVRQISGWGCYSSAFPTSGTRYSSYWLLFWHRLTYDGLLFAPLLFSPPPSPLLLIALLSVSQVGAAIHLPNLSAGRVIAVVGFFYDIESSLCSSFSSFSSSVTASSSLSSYKTFLSHVVPSLFVWACLN